MRESAFDLVGQPTEESEPPRERCELAHGLPQDLAVVPRLDLRELCGPGLEEVSHAKEQRSARGFAAYPNAKKYKDYRKMFETEGKNIDAVMIATPDHMHTPVALLAMQRGKHVYCEKPLTRTPWEAQLLAGAAVKYKVATQMGNQGWNHEGTKTACEILWSDEIGDVKELHAWTGGIYGGQPNICRGKMRMSP